jgi:hypothetical protein
MPSLLRRALACTGVLGVCSLIGGCSTPTTSPNSGERPGIVLEAWRGIGVSPSVPWDGPRTAVYTYVLVGDVGGREYTGSNEQILRSRRGLFELLKEVQAGQAADNVRDAELLARTNQFCIPSTAKSDQRVDESTFGFELASEYINYFKLALGGREVLLSRLDNVGPFLIATRLPLGEIVRRNPDGRLSVDVTAPVLLIDLSGEHPKAMPSYAKAFKEAVRRDEVVESKRLTPLRPAFASAVLKLNEAIPFVVEAFASARNAIEGTERK